MEEARTEQFQKEIHTAYEEVWGAIHDRMPPEIQEKWDKTGLIRPDKVKMGLTPTEYEEFEEIMAEVEEELEGATRDDLREFADMP